MAITFDTATGAAGGGGTSQSYSHTIGASAKPYLICFVLGTTNNAATGTYNSVSMTQLGYVYNAALGSLTCLGIANPTVGSNTLSVNHPVSIQGITSSSYFGVGTTQPDTTANNYVTLSGGITVTTTTTKNNDWLVMGTVIGGGSAPQTMGGARVSVGASSQVQLFDSGASLSPAGSYSLSPSGAAANNNILGLLVSISEGTASSNFLAFM